MKLVTLASLLVVALSFALVGAPAISDADSHSSTCETCSQGAKTGKPGEHRWEYKCVRPSKKADAMTSQFNALGADGWRLKEADSGFWCFAKPKAR